MATSPLSPKAKRALAEQRKLDAKILAFVTERQSKGWSRDQIAEAVFQRMGYLVKRITGDQIVLRGVKDKDWIIDMPKRNPAKKARKSKKAPSAAQIAWRKKFAAAAKKRRALGRKSPAKKRNGKTVIKAKRVTILNLTKKKNPPRKANITSASDLQYAGTAKKATQDGVKGWMLGSKFFPGSATTKAQKITASAYLDLRTGDVWKRKAKGNPKRKKNIAGFMQDGVFHPIRSGVEQRTVGGKKKLVKSKKAYKPSKVGEKRTYSAKKSAKRAAQSRSMTAATKQRKATTTRLASRSLQRSVPLKKTRRNPGGVYEVWGWLKSARDWRFLGNQDVHSKAAAISNTRHRLRTQGNLGLYSKFKAVTVRRNPDTPAELLKDFRGYPKDKDSTLYFAEGTPTGLYKLGSLYQIRLVNGTKIKPTAGNVWLCADTKGKLYLGTTDSKQVLANAPRGSLGKVQQVEYTARKSHLGDSQVTRYYHNLGEETGEKPSLYSDGKGGLLFKGGATYVRSDGIHN